MALIAQPPGVRATSDGGRWFFCRGTSGSNYVMNDFSLMEDRIGKVQFEVLRQELFFKMKRAESGKLAYGPGPHSDVEQMQIAKDVLELRLSDRSGDEENLIHVRFFFSEPIDLPGMMIGLGLMWKRPGPAGKDEQNQAALIAAQRLREFSQRDDYRECLGP